MARKRAARTGAEHAESLGSAADGASELGPSALGQPWRRLLPVPGLELVLAEDAGPAVQHVAAQLRAYCTSAETDIASLRWSACPAVRQLPYQELGEPGVRTLRRPRWAVLLAPAALVWETMLEAGRARSPLELLWLRGRLGLVHGHGRDRRRLGTLPRAPTRAGADGPAGALRPRNRRSIAAGGTREVRSARCSRRAKALGATFR